MAEDKLKQLLANARKSVEDANNAENEAKQRKENAWRERAERLEQLVLPRLEAAKQAWQDTATLEISKQTKRSSILPDKEPSISFRISDHNPSGRGRVRSSLTYFFVIAESGSIRVYEGATRKNGLNHQIGLSDGQLDDSIIDKVLEIAAKDYFSRDR